jgi:hypothetical protein
MSKELSSEIRTKYEDYRVVKKEAHLVHVVLGRKVDDPVRKVYNTFLQVQKFEIAAFEGTEKAGVFKQYDIVEILYHPNVESTLDRLEESKGTVGTNGTLAGTSATAAPAVAPAVAATGTPPKAKTAKEKTYEAVCKEYEALLGAAPDKDATYEEIMEAIKETRKVKE